MENKIPLLLPANESEKMRNKRERKPDWLKIKIPLGKNYTRVKKIVEDHNLHTICTSGHCPNIADCWSRSTATLMILGDVCTRSCKFCNVKTGKPLSVDMDEPIRIAESVKLLGIKHLVLTSVDRDDLEDLGGGIWVETIIQVKKENPQTTIETLIPDFQGREGIIQSIIDASPEVISHNLETVSRLTPSTRSVAKYETSLQVLKYIAASGKIAKTGIMLGLGEREEEVVETMKDAYDVGCKVFTIGQYLQPTTKHLSVQEYVHPDIFAKYKQIGKKIGFSHIESHPLVRSSYRAEGHVR